MKLSCVIGSYSALLSPPTRGAWIETVEARAKIVEETMSPPTRGAWIETVSASPKPSPRQVAPHTGGVD